MIARSVESNQGQLDPHEYGKAVTSQAARKRVTGQSNDAGVSKSNENRDLSLKRLLACSLTVAFKVLGKHALTVSLEQLNAS